MAVVVTFTEELTAMNLKKRLLGTMKGTIKMTDGFNEPIDDLKDYM